MKHFSQTVNEQLEAQRFQASQASREQSSEILLANATQRWQELFDAGLYSEARRFWFREVERAAWQHRRHIAQH